MKYRFEKPKKPVTKSPAHPEWTEQAYYVARKVWVHLEKGHFAAARNIIQLAEAELRQLQFKTTLPLDELLEEPVAQAPLSNRTVNLLEENAIFTIGQVANLTKEEIVNFKNLGHTTYEEIVGALVTMGVFKNDAANPEKAS